MAGGHYYPDASSTAMAARYQHVTDPIRQDVAKRVGKRLWAEIDQDGEA